MLVKSGFDGDNAGLGGANKFTLQDVIDRLEVLKQKKLLQASSSENTGGDGHIDFKQRIAKRKQFEEQLKEKRKLKRQAKKQKRKSNVGDNESDGDSQDEDDLMKTMGFANFGGSQ
ncbi:unnamed protein product [Ambrosiozyma monospora]|uniref:Unnamed protein product n=1 Tax=Ambrosiozyma monospora TaxID=43982 RepID=A0ACB5U108_AMBMO|nr:unnamed protein product [Ambrosiozyma monospora]